MNFIVVGTNYKYSPIEFREGLVFHQHRVKDALFLLKERDILKGALILSTCNRVEIYASVLESKAGIKEIEDFICLYHEINREKLLAYLYEYTGPQALEHLFSVACGLDSLILGETQILGQVKSAFSQSEESGFIDEALFNIFYAAISLAKGIHQSNEISAGKVSVGSVAIDFIKERIGDLTGKSLLIIGAGKVTELVLRYLEKEGPKVVFVSNRTFDRARDWARQINAQAVRFDHIKQYLARADVVISATASPHFVIRKETLSEVTGHKILIIDLGLPRDVDPIVSELENTDLFCLEDLDAVIERNKQKKALQAGRIRKFIEREAQRQCPGFTKLGQEPALLR